MTKKSDIIDVCSLSVVSLVFVCLIWVTGTLAVMHTHMGLAHKSLVPLKSLITVKTDLRGQRAQSPGKTNNVKFFKNSPNVATYHNDFKDNTPVITLFISGLKSRVLKLSFLSLKMTVKSGLEFILKFTEPLQRYLLSCQANSAILGRCFCTGQQQL